LVEAQSISTELGIVRFSDIVPRDVEAEAHAREHLEATGALDEDMQIVDGPLKEKADAELLEDMLNSLSTNEGGMKQKRPTVEDVQRLKDRLGALLQRIGITGYLS
jgi:hypothetical protein